MKYCSHPFNPDKLLFKGKGLMGDSNFFDDTKLVPVKKENKINSFYRWEQSRYLEFIQLFIVQKN